MQEIKATTDQSLFAANLADFTKVQLNARWFTAEATGSAVCAVQIISKGTKFTSNNDEKVSRDAHVRHFTSDAKPLPGTITLCGLAVGDDLFDTDIDVTCQECSKLSYQIKVK